MTSSADLLFQPPIKLLRRTISLHDSFSSSPLAHYCSSFADGLNKLRSFTDNSSDTFLQLSIASSTTTAASSTSDASSRCCLHPPLQPHLWSELPEELVERILAFLPVSSFFRFRSVCKGWQSLPFSRGFLELTTQVRAQGPHFLVLSRSRCHHLSAYEPLSNKWYGFPVDFLPTVTYPVAAAKGLICFVNPNFETGYTTLLVCNPLTRRWKELPSMSYARVPFLISMAVDRKARTYKILVAGGSEFSYGDRHQLPRRSTEMYDSARGTWISCGPLPQNEEISRNMVEYYGYYLCLSRGTGSGLLAFNVQTQAWIKMRTGRIPGYSKFRHLVECGGSILIVGKALRRYVLGLYIWCLDPATLRWKEVGKMPRAISEQFFSSPSECFYCTSQGHLIFFSRYFCDQGLVYNIVENSWQQVTGCPLLTNSLVLPFDPGLDPVD